jgi:hypothetical protein
MGRKYQITLGKHVYKHFNYFELARAGFMAGFHEYDRGYYSLVK